MYGRIVLTVLATSLVIAPACGAIVIPNGGFAVTSLNLGSSTSGVAISAGGAYGNFVYVAGSNALYRVAPDLSGSTPFATGLGSGSLRPTQLRFDPGVYGTNELYLSRDDGFVIRVPAVGAASVHSNGNSLFSSNELEFARPGGLFGNLLYVSNGGAATGTISMVTSAGANSTFAAQASFSATPVGLAFPAPGSAFGTNLYSGLFNGQIVQVDPSGAVTPFSSIGGGLADGFAFSPGGALGDNLYVADFTNDRIMVVNSAGTASVFATGFNFVDGIDTKIAIKGDGSGLYISEGQSIVLINIPAGMSGDYNDDGMVDAADYVVWRKFENTATALPNDPNGLPIDGDQYNTWLNYFGQPAGGGAGTSANAAVPEPATMVLLIATAAGVSTGRRWRTWRVSKLVNA